jgi:hypothetical protein
MQSKDKSLNLARSRSTATIDLGNAEKGVSDLMPLTHWKRGGPAVIASGRLKCLWEIRTTLESS